MSTEDVAKITTVTELKARFSPQLSDWGFSPNKLRLLTAIFENWLEPSGSRMDVRHFRQKHRRSLEDIDWMLGRQYIHSQDGISAYTPRFSAFAVLFVAGNTRAARIRGVCDHVLKLVRGFLAERGTPLVRPLGTVLDLLTEQDRELALPALLLMSDCGIGVYLNTPNLTDGALSFSDTIYRHKNATSFLASFLDSYFGQSPRGALFAPTAPLELAHLQLAPDAYQNAQKALDRVLSHPDSAVTSARSTLEAVFKHVLGEKLPRTAQTFPALVSACKEPLALGSEFEAVGRSIGGLANAINDVRDRLSDAHGKKPGSRAPTRAEARLVVGVSLLLSEFLLDRWEVARSLERPAKHQTVA
jgi:hypothetical protein